MRRRALQAFIGVLCVLLPGASVANYVLISRALKDGKDARATQCRTFPVTIKLYQAARHYHFITQRDLETYLRSAPRDCP